MSDIAKLLARVEADIRRKGLKPYTPEEAAEVKARQYRCTTCRDSGRLSLGIPDYRDPDFGKTIPCPDCSRVGTHPGLDGMKLPPGSNFGKRLPQLKQELITTCGFWYLYGVHGIGKTYIGRAVQADALKQGKPAAMLLYADLLGEMKKAMDGAYAGGPESVLDKYAGMKVLILDEMDKFKGSEWATDVQTRLLNKRYDQYVYERRGFTLLISNYDPGVTFSDAPHLLDRMTDGRVTVAWVQLQGGSLRPDMEV